MEIFEVNAKEYAEVINSPYHVFGSAAFNHLNRDKTEEVCYLLFREGKYRLGIIGGIRDNRFYSPYSAPFGGFTYISPDTRIQYIEEAIRLIIAWALKRQLFSINITLPPPVYERSFIAKQVNCFRREGFELSEIDLNYSFDLSLFDENYPGRIWYNARKNLKVAMNAGLVFAKCDSDAEKSLAYDIIRTNREHRGFPLHMPWQQVYETTGLVPADFFLVYNSNHAPVASAIVFHVNKTVVQVVYWGDMPGFQELKPMNYLSFNVFGFYKASGMKYTDIGISTEGSVPNYGLCEFKESIGCDIDSKFKFTKVL